MPTVRPTLSEIRSTTARLVRDELVHAAREDGVLQDDERAALTPFVQAAAAGLTRLEDVVDAAMQKATSTWASFNQASGSGKAWLSRAEIEAVRAQDAPLGVLTAGASQIASKVKGTRAPLAVALDAPPGVAMGVSGVRVLDVGLSAGASVPAGTSFSIVVDGHALSLSKTAGGLDTSGLKAPEGYGIEVLERSAFSDPSASVRLKITRDAETALPDVLLVARAKAGLVGYLKNERITSSDWANYFPTRWEENVARGVLDKLDALFTSTETEVIRSKDSVTFVGRGPYDLYTEVTVNKSDGAVTNAYVEID